MKSCELCKLAARTYCESDQASLCWDCDAKVHGANFLVARHVRCLLCHACQSHTPWRATGSKLSHTVSVCERCVNGDDREESEAGNNDEEDEEGEAADSEDDVSVGDDVEDGDNQVVPWSTAANTPPPASSSSSSEDSCGGELDVSKSINLFSLKRLRENVSDLPSQVDLDRLSPKRRYGYRTRLATRCRPEEEAVSVDSMRLSKDQQIKAEGTVQFQSDSRGAAITESLGEKLESDKIQ
ncbi:zinc finger protein CONSTANS-LIKE 1-like [Durio zibethinus]|uniref:Zinc finger protein CONSTANS-LIKE 1-like n=1 Tax=Durio zibethinus TaxID=66656 RepID=A0A6P6AC68_DURZI|nr:zinc finger protein CONSTANS-LIKE 1-like [Durio zibethinus]